MKRICLAAALAVLPFAGQAQSAAEDILAGHILPRFEALAGSTATLAEIAEQDCQSTSNTLRAAYHTAFDAWVSASHLRFGPTETEDRAFALAFWPDTRGATPRLLAALVAERDPVALTPDQFREVSIAARGFYALEFLLYDKTLSTTGDPAYRCALIQTVTADMAATSAAILEDWERDFADKFLHPGPEGFYRNIEEVMQELFKSLSAGLQFTSETRLGRPLGSFDRPRPNRAEARRSGRSRRHVLLSLASLHDLAIRLAASNADLSDQLNRRFLDATQKMTALQDPVFASLSTPQDRLKLEVVQQSVDLIRETVTRNLGPTLGVAAGFNSLDGD